MRKHIVKIELTEDELNEVLDSKMENDIMADALLCYSRGSLKKFLTDNGFENKSINKIARLLLKEIIADVEIKREYGITCIEDVIELEELMAFYLAMNPLKHTKILGEKIGRKKIINLLRKK